MLYYIRYTWQRNSLLSKLSSLYGPALAEFDGCMRQCLSQRETLAKIEKCNVLICPLNIYQKLLEQSPKIGKRKSLITIVSAGQRLEHSNELFAVANLHLKTIPHPYARSLKTAYFLGRGL